MRHSVSVIIPVYNGAAFIGRAIDSALAQSHRPLEIIVVNDGSQDDTLAALAPYGPRIHLISIANGGVSNARNVGMRASTGELIAFLDADDVWHPNKLQMQVASLDAYPRAGLCCCDYMVFNHYLGHAVNHFSACKKGMTYDRPFDAGLLPALLRCNFVGTASSVILRRTLMHKAGLFNTSYRQAEDYDYWLRCATEAPFVVLSARLMDKKSHDSNLTNNMLETLTCHEQVLLDLLAGHTLGTGACADLTAALAQQRARIAQFLFQDGQFGAALRRCWLALRTDPSWPLAAQLATLIGKKSAARLLGRRARSPQLGRAALGQRPGGN
jgi:cellulose synthase/poly-beta-1,6-N-acetylglucosamine synthase-like glycosyltransferase